MYNISTHVADVYLNMTRLSVTYISWKQNVWHKLAHCACDFVYDGNLEHVEDICPFAMFISCISHICVSQY